MPLFWIYCSCFLALLYSLAFLSLLSCVTLSLQIHFWATIYLRVTKTTTASQLKETVWTQNVLGATGVALSLLHSSHSSANSCWGGSATLRRLQVDGWAWRRVELWPPLLPSLHVMPSCSRVLRTLNGRLPSFFFFRFPLSYQGDKNVKTGKWLPGDGFNYFLAPFPVVTAELEWQITNSCQISPL